MEVKYEIHLSSGRQRELAHTFLHEVSRIEQSWQIMKDVLGFAFRPYAGYRQAGSLGLGAYDGEMLSHQGVEQGGLAHVWGAGEGDMAGSAKHEPR
jgi:hypothetical protein